MELKDILERLRRGQSIKGIKRELKRHKTVIREVKRIAEENNWLDSTPPLPSEKQLKKAYEASDDECRERSHPLDAYIQDIERWLKDDYSYLVIHKLLSKRIACSESTLRRYVHRKFPPALHLRIPVKSATHSGAKLPLDTLCRFLNQSETKLALLPQNMHVGCFIVIIFYDGE